MASDGGRETQKVLATKTLRALTMLRITLGHQKVQVKAFWLFAFDM